MHHGAALLSVSFATPGARGGRARTRLRYAAGRVLDDDPDAAASRTRGTVLQLDTLGKLF